MPIEVIEIQSKPGGVNCIKDCEGLCCRGAKKLNLDEYNRLGGDTYMFAIMWFVREDTIFRPQSDNDEGSALMARIELKEGYGLFGIKGDYCHLYDPATHECLIYDDRPENCKDFERGGVMCQTERIREGFPMILDLNIREP